MQKGLILKDLIAYKSNITHFNKWFTIPEFATYLPDVYAGIAELTIVIAIPTNIYIVGFENKNS